MTCHLFGHQNYYLARCNYFTHSPFSLEPWASLKEIKKFMVGSPILIARWVERCVLALLLKNVGNCTIEIVSVVVVVS